MMNNYGWAHLDNEKGFVVAFPNGTRDQDNQRFWDVDHDFHSGLDIDDDGFLRELALHLQNEYQLDPDRTFVTTPLPNFDPHDGSTVQLKVYSSFFNTLKFRYYLVLGGGHDWPGRS